MSDQNEMRAEFGNWHKQKFGFDLGPAYDNDGGSQATRWSTWQAARTTPAPQAAPSGLPHAPTSEMMRAWFKTPRSGEGDAAYFGPAYRAMLAAAPAVAITQAATSEPVAKVIHVDESMGTAIVMIKPNLTLEVGARLYAAAMAAAPSNARPLYQVWMHSISDWCCATKEEYDRTQSVYRQCWAAPVAHLAGTTPNTEAPSEPTEGQMAAACKAYSDFPDAPDAIAAKTWMQDRLRASISAALSAQQAGVQESNHD